MPMQIQKYTGYLDKRNWEPPTSRIRNLQPSDDYCRSRICRLGLAKSLFIPRVDKFVLSFTANIYASLSCKGKVTLVEPKPRPKT